MTREITFVFGPSARVVAKSRAPQEIELGWRLSQASLGDESQAVFVSDDLPNADWVWSLTPFSPHWFRFRLLLAFPDWTERKNLADRFAGYCVQLRGWNEIDVVVVETTRLAADDPQRRRLWVVPQHGDIPQDVIEMLAVHRVQLGDTSLHQLLVQEPTADCIEVAARHWGELPAMPERMAWMGCDAALIRPWAWRHQQHLEWPSVVTATKWTPRS